MTELQIGLIGLGVVAVSGVVVYNTWLEYRHRQLAQQLLQPSQDDVLLGRSDRAEEPGFPEPQALAPAIQRAEPDSEYVTSAAWGNDALEAPDEFEEFDEVDEPQAMPTLAENPIVEAKRSASTLAERTEPVLSKQIPSSERIEPVLRIEEPPAPVPAVAPPKVEISATVPTPKPRPASFEPPVAPILAVPDKAVFEAAESGRGRAPEAATEEYREVPEPQHLLLPSIDYIAAFEAIEPTSAAQILGFQRETLAQVRKPIHWFGHNELTREWEAVDAAESVEYRSLRVGLQLVDRRGPVSETDLTAFHVAMHDLAHSLMAIVDMPHRQTVLETAAALDEFCAGVDIQIGINVISTAAPFPGTKIRALAEAAGMLIEGGRFVRADDDGNILYVLLNQDAAGFSGEAMKSLTTHGLTFLLDVPTAAHGDRVFNQIVDLAKRFADVLKGSLVDDNRRPLSDGALEPIRRQIAQYQSTMAARKLPAGGRLAKRLFS